uniref:Phage protein n=1 Tax=Schistosoma curassoni TaxID=6186 RepID=A0A183JRK5_9TREM
MCQGILLAHQAYFPQLLDHQHLWLLLLRQHYVNKLNKAQRGFLFHPISNRMFEGQQVYRLESLQVFFDRNVSYVYNPSDGGWLPVTFTELMTRAQY